MSVNTNTTVGSRTISAFFDNGGAARQAVDDLVKAGIPREHIAQTGGQDAAAQSSRSGSQHTFWDSLKDFFLPDEDRGAYAEGLRRGGTLVSVRADEANYTRVLDILDTDGAVDMDERERHWRSQGWSSDRRQPAHPVAVQSITTQDISARVYDANAPRTATAAGDIARAEALDTSVSAAASAARRDDSHGRFRVRSYLHDDAPGDAGWAGAARSRIVEHMDVISADGQSIGTVDHLDGPDRIKLAKNTSPDGQHHFVPIAWIDHVDQHVHLRKTLAEIKAGS